MKTYPAPPFTEAFIIQIPASVRDDKELNWTDRVAYFFFVHYKGDTAAVIEELGLKVRRFQFIKSRLADRGHIVRVEERGQIKYIAVDLDTSYWLRMQRFRERSRVGFKLIADQNILSLEKFHSRAHILHCMEVLEWTYRKSGGKILKPHHMLTRSCKTGVTPAADFVPGFWEKDAEHVEKPKSEPARIVESEKKASSEEKVLDKVIYSMTKADKDLLEKRAIEEIRANGGLARFGKSIQIAIKMREIVKREVVTNA